MKRTNGQSMHLQMLPKNGVRTMEVISYLIWIPAHMVHTLHWNCVVIIMQPNYPGMFILIRDKTLGNTARKPMTFSSVATSQSSFLMEKLGKTLHISVAGMKSHKKMFNQETFGRYLRTRFRTLKSCCAFLSMSILRVLDNREYGVQGNPAQYVLTLDSEQP